MSSDGDASVWLLNFTEKLSTEKAWQKTQKKSLDLEGVWITLVFPVNAKSFSETMEDTADWLQVC